MKETYLILLIGILFIQASRPECVEGTLKCDTSKSPGQPQICDFKNSFVLNTTLKKCQKRTVEGCELPSFDFQKTKCFRCQNGMHIDETAVKCVNVLDENLKENCLSYAKDGLTCVQCKQGHWFDGAECLAVNKTSLVSQCVRYISATQCGECGNGNFLEDGACKPFKVVEGCKYHTNRVCEACETGFVFMPYYNEHDPISEHVKQSILEDKLSDAKWTARALKTPICYKSLVANCKTQISFDKCQECDLDFYLTSDHQCMKNPEVQFPNCQVYQDDGQCVRCKGPFYLQKDPSKCIPAHVVENCQRYSIFEDTCEICVEHYWIEKALNRCKLRQHNQVDYCLGYHEDQDRCTGCEQDMTMTRDARKCIPNLKHCANQKAAQHSNSESHICIRCEDDFYLRNGECLERSVPNCRKYKFDNDACETCSKGYYLSTNNHAQCLKQDIKYCIRYMENEEQCAVCEGERYPINHKCMPRGNQHCQAFRPHTNRCSVCQRGFYLKDFHCFPQRLPNCKIFRKNTNACLECHLGFYKRPGKNICTLLDIDSCAEYDLENFVCSKCSPRFYVVAGACRRQNVFNCIEYIENTNKCVDCGVNFYLRDGKCFRRNKNRCQTYVPKSNDCAICPPNSYLKNGSCYNYLIYGCILQDRTRKNCLECGIGYFKKEIEGYFRCIPQKKENCIEFEENSMKCSQCAKGFYMKSNNDCVRFPGIANCIEFDENTGRCVECGQLYWLDEPNQICKRDTIQDCLVYKDSALGCQKCAKGYRIMSNGTACVHLDINNCAVYDMTNGECTQCVMGFALNNNRCIELSVFGCLEYSNDGRCQVCQQGNYRANGKCHSYTVQNCVEYSGSSGDCSFCGLGYYLDVPTNICVALSVQNCLSYTHGTGTCTKCAMGYQLKNGNECERFDTALCIAFNQLGVCVECPKDKYMDNGVCRYRKSIHCVEFDGSSNDCATCQHGFYLNVDKECKRQSVVDCIDYVRNENTCIKCRDGNYIDNGECPKQRSNYCVEFEYGTPFCLTCRDGFFIGKRNSCYPSSRRNCITYLKNLNECKQCADGYHISSGSCAMNSVAYCIQYDSQGDCLTCAVGYFRTSGQECDRENVLNCAIHSSKTECSRCVKTFTWNPVTKACETTNINKCLEHNNSLSGCLKCQPGYYHDAAGVCQVVTVQYCIDYEYSTNNCVLCGAGSYLASASSCLKQDAANCIEFEANTNNCRVCGVEFIVSNNACERQSQPNCIKHIVNLNECLVCAVNFYPDASGVCQQQNQVANCVEYGNNSEECLSCRPGTYLKSSSECAVNSVVNCIEYTTNTNTCTKCAKLSMLVSEECVGVTLIDNCVTYDALYTKCTECSEKYYSNDTNACQAVTAQNCKQVTPNENKCNECNDTYYPDSEGVCQLQSIIDCDVYIANENTCLQCVSRRHSIDDGVSCGVIIVIANCTTLSPHASIHTCDTCDSLFFRVGNPEGAGCAPIADTANCQGSDGLIDHCDRCKPENFRNKETKLCSESRAADMADKECEYNNETSSNRKCTKCKSGFALINGLHPIRPSNYKTDNNCLDIDHNTGLCNKCPEYYELKSGVCTGPRAWEFNMACIQKKSGHAHEDLMTNKNCVKCHDQELYYIGGGKCFGRGDYAEFMVNCAEKHNSGRYCKRCEATTGKYMQEHRTTINPYNGSMPVSHCAISYKGNCVTCSPGYTPVLGGKVCREINTNEKAFVKRSFKPDLDNREPIVKTTGIVTNCAIYSQIYDEEIGCTKCRSGFVGIVGDPGKSGTKLFAYTRAKNNSVRFDDVVNVFEKCRPDYEAYLYSTNYTDKSTPDGTCLIGYQKDPSKSGFACLLCREYHMGEIGTVSHFANGDPIGINIMAVVNCVAKPSHEMTKIHRGMFFSNYMNQGDQLQRSSYLFWDTCPVGKRPIYMIVTSLEDMKITFPTKTEESGNRLKVMYCLPEANIPEVPGCQIYSLYSDLDANLNTLTSDLNGKTTCAVCQPGFESAGTGSTCVDLTSHCEIAESDFLGGCMTAKNPYSYNHSDPFAIPTDSTPNELGCKIQSKNENKECWMCELGWFWRDGKCKQVYDNVNCKARMGANFIQPELYSSGLAQQMNTFANLIWHSWEDALLPRWLVDFPRSGCFSSVTGPIFAKTDTSHFTCTATSRSTKVSGCLFYNTVRDMETCLECKSGQIRTSTGKCKSNSGYTNCSVAEHDRNGCKYCAKGYNKVASYVKHCVSKNCKELSPYNSDHCYVCNDNASLIKGNIYKCGDEDTTSNCLNFSAYLQKCVKCRVEGEIPFNKVLYHSSRNIELLRPVECRAFPVTGNGYAEFRYEYLYYQTVFKTYWNDFSLDRSFRGVSLLNKKNLYYTNGKKNGDLANNLCLPFNSTLEAGCDEMGFVFCKTCSSGYYRFTDGGCRKIQKSGCKTGKWKNGSEACLSCKPDHIPDRNTEPRTCTLRIKSPASICPDRHSSEDKCISCPDGRYLNGVNCPLNTALNCATKSRTENKCTLCDKDTWLDKTANDVCKPYRISKNCYVWEEFKDDCAECNEGRVKVANNCVQSTATYCKTFVPNMNECATCDQNFMLSEDKASCIPKTTANCKTYTDLENECATCYHGFYLEGANCQPKLGTVCKIAFDSDLLADKTKCASCTDRFIYDTSLKTCTIKVKPSCKEISLTADECTVCSKEFYFDTGACLIKPQGTCLNSTDSTMIADSSKCLDCGGQYSLSGDNCDLVTNRTCLTFFNDKPGCKTCPKERYDPDGKGFCLPKAATLCFEFHETKDECASCGKNHYSNKGNCLAILGNNCLTIVQDTGYCATCDEGWLISADSKHSKHCEQNSASDCLKWSNVKKVCDKCSPGFKLDAAKVNCIRKTAKLCKTFVDDNEIDRCATCGLGMVFDSSDGNCRKSIAVDCSRYDSGTDKCASCSDLFYRSERSGSCVLRDAMNCKTYSTNQRIDVCQDCSEGFILDKQSKWCEPNNGQSCKTFSQTEHKCATCSDNFSLGVHGVCKANISRGCLTFKEGALGCGTCSLDTHYKVGNSCHPRRSRNCTTYEPTKNACLTCADGFMKDSQFNCIKRRAKLCKAYASGTTDECLTCQEGFYKDGANCILNTGKSCLTYTDNADGCETCPDLFHTDQQGCKRSTAGMCSELKSDEDKCASCESGYRMESSKRRCISNEAKYCKTISNASDKCATCSDIFRLSSGKCVRNTTRNCKELSQSRNACNSCSWRFYRYGSCNWITRSTCKTFKWNSNRCATCSDTFYMHSSKTHCRPLTYPYCIDYDSTIKRCKRCSNQYYLNPSNGSCLLKTRFYCKKFKLDNTNTCEECADNYVLNTSNWGCISNLAKNCKTFRKSEHKCSECADLHFRDKDDECVRVTTENCSEMKNGEDKCVKCIRGWVVDDLSGKCLENTAENCAVHQESRDGCQRCQRGYWLDTDICKKLTATNCWGYKPDKDECSNCKEGFYIKTTGQGEICLEHTAENCERYKRTEDKCEACRDKFYIDETNEGLCVPSSAQFCKNYARNKNQCASCQEGKLTAITPEGILCTDYTAPNCQVFKKQHDSCLQCQEGFFADVDFGTGTMKCLIRQITDCVEFIETDDGCEKCADTHHVNAGKACQELSSVKHCVKYSLYEDKCLECDEGFYKKPDVNECWANPDGIANCVEYKREGMCWRCDSTTYLDTAHNQCKPVILPVDNCERYFDTTSCKQCKPEFVLEGNQCKQITALNCDRPQTATRCLTCIENHLLHYESGECTPSGIDQCKTAVTTIKGPSCSQCQPGYLLSKDQMQCETPKNTIGQCLDYMAEGICQTCIEGYVTAIDRKSCLLMTILAESHCTQGHLTKDAFCDKCHFGYGRTHHGGCQLLSPSKCALVDFKTEKCLLCAPGTHMNDREECIGVPSDAVPQSREKGVWRFANDLKLIVLVVCLLTGFGGQEMLR